MRRRDLERHLQVQGCHVHREGGAHTIWVNPANGLKAPVPRHTEVKLGTAQNVCRLLGIPAPPIN